MLAMSADGATHPALRTAPRYRVRSLREPFKQVARPASIQGAFI
jgi:hypothetical protein